jgi:hypothetical protein
MREKISRAVKDRIIWGLLTVVSTPLLGDQSNNNYREKPFRSHNLNLWPGHVSRIAGSGRCLRRESFPSNGNFGNFRSV